MTNPGGKSPAGPTRTEKTVSWRRHAQRTIEKLMHNSRMAEEAAWQASSIVIGKVKNEDPATRRIMDRILEIEHRKNARPRA